MRVAAVIAVALLTAMPATAAAPSVEDLFQQFGLFGTWAADCKEPATPGNPHVSITMPTAGLVLEDHDLGSDFAVNRYSVLAAKRVSAERLSVEVIFRPGAEGEERQKLVFLIHNDTRRTMFNQANGGPVRVKDGIALVEHTKTPPLRKCG
jgi:ribosomal protein S28E/S33